MLAPYPNAQTVAKQSIQRMPFAMRAVFVSSDEKPMLPFSDFMLNWSQ